MGDWMTSSPFCPISPCNPGDPGGPWAPFSILQSPSKIEITAPVTLWNGQSKEPHKNLYTFCLLTTTSLSPNGLSEYVYLKSLFTMTWSLHSFHEFAEWYYNMTKKELFLFKRFLLICPGGPGGPGCPSAPLGPSRDSPSAPLSPFWPISPGKPGGPGGPGIYRPAVNHDREEKGSFL